jgi:hypothetical protein
VSASVDPASEVKLGVLVFDGVFGVSLVKSSIAVKKYGLGPAGEDIFVEIV